MTTNQEAVDDIYTKFKVAWDTVGHPVIFQDVPLDTAAQAAIDTQEIPWCRVSIRHNTRVQATLNGPGGRRFDARGIFIGEIYTPTGDGMTLARSLSRLVEQAFEGISTPNGVWFRNVRTQEIGPDGNFTHVNVIAEFQYDEVR